MIRYVRKIRSITKSSNFSVISLPSEIYRKYNELGYTHIGIVLNEDNTITITPIKFDEVNI